MTVWTEESWTEHICSDSTQLSRAEGSWQPKQKRKKESTSVNRTKANLVNRQSSPSSSPPPPVVASSYQHRFIFFSLPSVPAKAQQNRELDRKSRSTVKECDWDLLPASWLLAGLPACLHINLLQQLTTFLFPSKNWVLFTTTSSSSSFHFFRLGQMRAYLMRMMMVVVRSRRRRRRLLMMMMMMTTMRWGWCQVFEKEERKIEREREREDASRWQRALLKIALQCLQRRQQRHQQQQPKCFQWADTLLYALLYIQA